MFSFEYNFQLEFGNISLKMEGVYFINTPELGDRSLFKIGWSQDINDRLKQLQTGNGFKLNLYSYILTSNRKLEKEIHASLNEYRKQGEWFDITESDVDEIVEQHTENDVVEESVDDEKDNIIEDNKELLEEVIEEIKTTRRVYHVERQESYTCDKCNKSFANKTYLTNHTQKNICVKKFVCQKCNVKFASAYSLRQHTKRKVPCIEDQIPSMDGLDENKCSSCGKCYSTKYNLKRHMEFCNTNNVNEIMIKMMETLIHDVREIKEENRLLKQQLDDNAN